MPKLQVFDPPMCCSTGVCGPSVDPKLVRFGADLEWLKSKGTQIERCNLAKDPGAFVHNATLKKAMNSQGMKCLPLLVLDGHIIASGGYPTRQELAREVGVEFEPGPVVKQRHADLVGITPSKRNERRRTVKLLGEVTRTLLFTGKGGVGKTSIACAPGSSTRASLRPELGTLCLLNVVFSNCGISTKPSRSLLVELR